MREHVFPEQCLVPGAVGERFHLGSVLCHGHVLDRAVGIAQFGGFPSQTCPVGRISPVPQPDRVLPEQCVRARGRHRGRPAGSFVVRVPVVAEWGDEQGSVTAPADDVDEGLHHRTRVGREGAIGQAEQRQLASRGEPPRRSVHFVPTGSTERCGCASRGLGMRGFAVGGDHHGHAATVAEGPCHETTGSECLVVGMGREHDDMVEGAQIRHGPTSEDVEQR